MALRSKQQQAAGIELWHRTSVVPHRQIYAPYGLETGQGVRRYTRACSSTKHLMTSAPFSGQRFAAFLFDMDGTILTSIAAAERVWSAWAQRHGLDVATFLPTIHGRRAIDTVRLAALPGVDPVAEAAAITQAEIEDVEGIQAIAGAAHFLASLDPKLWAIVTSAPRALALRRIQAAGLPMPEHLITSDDIEHGKPAPDCFLLGAQRLGVDSRQCLVFEDAPAGIAAGHAAGASVLVVTATHAHAAGGHASAETDNRAASTMNAPATAAASIVDYQGLSVSVDDAGTLQLVPRG